MARDRARSSTQVNGLRIDRMWVDEAFRSPSTLHHGRGLTMCEDMTEVRVVDPTGKHGHLTWYWPTSQLHKVLPMLGLLTVRDSVGARYSDFTQGCLVFDQTGVRYEVTAATITDAHPDAATKPPE